MHINTIIAQRADTPKELSPVGKEFFESLPEYIRPMCLAVRYPHILEKIALFWGEPLHLEDYLQSLLLSDRLFRKGFEPDAFKEISTLHSHVVSVRAASSPKPVSPWEHIAA